MPVIWLGSDARFAFCFALCLRPVDVFAEALLVRPRHTINDLESRLEGFTVDSDSLDRPPPRPRCPCSICAPSKGGSCRTRCGVYSLFYRQQDLGVRADVDRQHWLLRVPQVFGESDRRRVRTHMPCDARRRVEARARGERRESAFARRRADRRGAGKREGRAAQGDGVDSQKM